MMEYIHSDRGGPTGSLSSAASYSYTSQFNASSVDQKDVIKERLNKELSLTLESTRTIRSNIAFASTSVGVVLMCLGISAGPVFTVVSAIDLSMWSFELLDRIINRSGS